jgi:hypothetical protein
MAKKRRLSLIHKKMLCQAPQPAGLQHNHHHFYSLLILYDMGKKVCVFSPFWREVATCPHGKAINLGDG